MSIFKHYAMLFSWNMIIYLIDHLKKKEEIKKNMRKSNMQLLVYSASDVT